MSQPTPLVNREAARLFKASNKLYDLVAFTPVSGRSSKGKPMKTRRQNKTLKLQSAANERMELGDESMRTDLRELQTSGVFYRDNDDHANSLGIKIFSAADKEQNNDDIESDESAEENDGNEEIDLD